MSLEDLFGSDLEDSEDEERGKKNSNASGKSKLNELFGDSPSDGEADERQRHNVRKKSHKNQQFESDSESGQESDNSKEHEKEEDDEKDEVDDTSQHQQSLTADLFGDDEDISSEDEEDKFQASSKLDYQSEKSQQDDSKATEHQTERQDILLEGEEEEEEDEGEETVIDVTIPYFKVSLGSEVHFVKMPNFMSVETKPFDSALYEDEIEDDEVLDEEGNARLKLKVENTIRWRSCKDPHGNDVKESNARVVRWSDGTLSLLLGVEIFDIHKTKIDGDFNHLFVQQGTGLQAQTVFKEKLTFRPHSTASQTHRKMTLSIADRASKARKIGLVPAAGKDPEAQRQEMIKKEEERLRSQLRLESQKRRSRERGHNKGLSASYLEPDRYGEEDDDFQSLLALKKKYKKDLAQGFRGALSDDESLDEGVEGLESDEEEDADRLLAAKEDKESDNEPDGTRRKRTSSEGGGTKKRKKVIVESDDEDSD